jgi:short-subunit dehydrogenase
MTNSDVILITGASSGIGAATALFFGRMGYKVVLTARRKDLLESLADKVLENGGDAWIIQADLAKSKDVQLIFDQIMQKLGKIDILINNAGLGRMHWLDQLDFEEDIEPQIDVNLSGLIAMTRMVLPFMIENRKGHIINIASVASFIGIPTYSIYAATKYGVRGFTESLRREVNIYGIHVSGIYPGAVETDFGKKAKIKRKTHTTTPSVLRLSPDDVVNAIYRVVRKPKKTVVIPYLMWSVIWVNRLLPGLVDYLIDKSFVNKERKL